MTVVPPLFDEKTLRKLEQLALVASKVRSGQMKGERRSVRRGTSIEFADYRNYAHGDDLRRLDWNIYARLERPFIKLFEEEEDLAIHILVDASTSMNWPLEGDVALHKFRYAQHITAGLGYIALGKGDRLSITTLNGYDQITNWGPLRGRGYTLDLLNFLSRQQAGQAVNLNVSIQRYAARTKRPGLCVVITDLLSADGYQDGLSALQSHGHEVVLIHVLSPDEINPTLNGDLQLIDSETGQPQDISVDGSMLDLYIDRLMAWRDEISTFCSRRGIRYAAVETSAPWESLILFELRRLGVVQ